MLALKREDTTRGKVLCADDDASALRPTTTALRRAGFEVDAVQSGHEAADALARSPYDAVLADLNMPGNERLELAQLRAVPVVILTGYPSLETAVGALRHGVVDYLTKPVELEDLVARMDAAVARGRALRALADAKERARALMHTVDRLEAAVARASAPTRDGVVEAPAPAPVDPLSHLGADDHARLSPRERDVARRLATGHTVTAVAHALGLSTNTVRNHVKSIFVKLGVHSQVALLAKLAGHVPPGAPGP